MNRNDSRTFWISIGLALFSVLVLYSYTNEQKADLTSKFGEKAQVVVAKADINEMETIVASMIEVVDRPKDFIEPGAVANPDIVVGQVALVPIKKSEQILESKILKPGPVTGLSMQVAPGKRALTLPIDEMRGVAKLIKPGDRVDLIASVEVGRGATQKREVKTVLEDVTVLATGLKIANELPRLFETVGKEDYIKNIRADTTFNNITLEVEPREAQNLVYILSTSPGSLFMTLRHPSDRMKVNLPQTNVESLLGRVSTDEMREQFRAPASAMPAQRAPVLPSSPTPERRMPPKQRKPGFREL
jgi:pilus assembly protein CpaB